MSSSDNSSISLNGNGEKVITPQELKHTLWQPSATVEVKEPLWHLRVSVLKDSEGRGDCPSRTFVSIHFLSCLVYAAFGIYTLSRTIHKAGMVYNDTLSLRGICTDFDLFIPGI